MTHPYLDQLVAQSIAHERELQQAARRHHDGSARRQVRHPAARHPLRARLSRILAPSH